MKDAVKVQIITIRNDGCVVNIVAMVCNRLSVTMLKAGVEVISEVIQPTELFAWLSNHQDW